MNSMSLDTGRGQVLVTTNQEDKYVITVIIASAVNVILQCISLRAIRDSTGRREKKE